MVYHHTVLNFPAILLCFIDSNPRHDWGMGEQKGNVQQAV